MNTDRSTATSGTASNGTDGSDGLGRREFVAVGVGAGTTLLAGCAGNESLNGAGGSGSTAGEFRLLISDLPADIGDFERLDVSFASARIFESAGDDGDEEEEADEEEVDDEGGEDADDEEADDGDDEEDAEDTDGDEDDGQRGFQVIDLDGATVDLTQVIGEDAMPVFEGELPAGRYEKIELEVADIEGIVDGEEAAVKVPSEKLQITTAFEISADEPLSFVFDINVVKRGQDNGYILQPVISESGVAGRDVDVNEVDPDERNGTDDDGDADEGEGSSEGGDESAEDGEAGGDGQEAGDGTPDGSDGTPADEDE